MVDDLTRLLELPAAARLSVAGDELALLTLRHEHANKIIIERQRLGASIDLGELFQLIGDHGLVETPAIQVTEITAPQLPAPVAAAQAPVPTTRRTTKRAAHSQPVGAMCTNCNRTFKNAHALEVHVGRSHKEQPSVSVTDDPVAPTEVPAPTDSQLCSVCGSSLRLHERCSDCQALLGPEHEAGSAHIHLNGKPLCHTCTSYRGASHKIGMLVPA